MRLAVITGAAVAVLAAAGIANATDPPTSTEPSTSAATTMAPGGRTTPGDTVETNAPAAIFDGDGNRIATIAVIGKETGWTNYEEGEGPEEGREYVRVVLDVASEVTEGSFGISVGDFILQDQHGFITGAASVRSAAQANADEEVIDEADLSNGESLELALTFQVAANVGPQSVFYRPDDDQLVDITELG